MKVKPFVLPLFFVLGLLFLLRLSSPRFAAAALPPISPLNPSAMFIENVGQFAEQARFQVQGGNGTMWLADDALWLTLLAPADPPADASADLFAHNQFPYNTPGAEPPLGVNIKLSFVGANTTPQLEPFGRRQTSVNYFSGNDPDRWHTDVPVWAGVRYAELYPDLDLEIVGEGGQLRPRLICHQNCSSALQQVRLQVEGAESLHLAEDHLILTTAAGNLVLPSLTFAITENNTTTTLNLIPHLENDTLSFHASSAHSPQPASPPTSDNLMDLLYGTFLGGGDDDASLHSAVDNLGNTYAVGYTNSTDFPTTPGTFDPTQNGSQDAFVLKLNPTGTDLVYSSFLGGGSGDGGYSLAVDDAGHAYVTGWTESANFPTTPGAYDTTLDNDRDAFIAQLNLAGNSLIYATFLGGDGSDEGRSIVVDTGGNAYVTGYTFSSDFPATPGAFDTTPNGNTDIFVAKFNSAGSDLIYATYVGGETNEFTASIAIDETGNTYVAGSTASSNFPTTPGAFDTTYNGGEYDGFVFKLNPTGSNLIYATYLGGTGADSGGRLAVDGAGHVYTTGQTSSANFPTTPGAFDTSHNGGEDGFVVKFNPTGSGLVYATFLGGGGNDTGWAIAVNDLGNAYITGYTSSASFPTTPGAFDPTHNGFLDSFFVNLNPAGSGLDYATFLGGNGNDVGYGISVDALGQVYISGDTSSVNFPTTPDAFDPTYNGGNGDSFIVKLAVVYIPAQASFSGSPTSGIAPLNVTFTNLSTGDFDTCAWDFGDGGSSNNCSDPTHLFTAAGVYTVSLTVSGLGGTDTLTQSNYITLYEPVVANFTGTPTRGTVPLNVIFTNLSAGDFYTCLWDFGDGATSTECISPVHTYDALGVYTVALTVNGPGGTATETKADYIVVEPSLLFLPLLRSANE